MQKLPRFVSQLDSVHLGSQAEKVVPVLGEAFSAGMRRSSPEEKEEEIRTRENLSTMLAVVCVTASALLAQVRREKSQNTHAHMQSFFSAGTVPLGQVSLSLKRVAESEPREYSRERREYFQEQGEKAKRYFGWVLGANYPGNQDWAETLDKLFFSFAKEKDGLETLCNKFLYMFPGVFPDGTPGKAVWTYTDEEGGIWEGAVDFTPDRELEHRQTEKEEAEYLFPAGGIGIEP